MNEEFWGAVFCTGLGAGLIGYGILLLVKTRRTRKWPTVQGEIIHSKFLYEGETCTFDIKYKYEVEGNQYTSDQVFIDLLGFNMQTNTPEWNKEMVDKYPLGKRVTVFYNPGNPMDAGLESKSHAADFFLFGVVVLIGGFIAFLYYFGIFQSTPGASDPI